MLFEIKYLIISVYEAVSYSCNRLIASNLPFRLLTNETQFTRAQIVKSLNGLGYKVSEKDVFAPIPTLVEMLRKSNLRPHLVVHKQVFHVIF